MKKKIKAANQQLEISKTNDYKAYHDFMARRATYRQMQEYHNRLHMTDDILDALIDDLELFFEDSNPDTQPLQLDDFLYARKIDRKKWSKWCLEHERLHDAWQWIKVLLSSRRETGLLRSRLYGPGVMRVQRHYSEVWNDVAEQEKKDKQEDLGKSTKDFTVIMRAIPEEGNEE